MKEKRQREAGAKRAAIAAKRAAKKEAAAADPAAPLAGGALRHTAAQRVFHVFVAFLCPVLPNAAVH